MSRHKFWYATKQSRFTLHVAVVLWHHLFVPFMTNRGRSTTLRNLVSFLIRRHILGSSELAIRTRCSIFHQTEENWKETKKDQVSEVGNWVQEYFMNWEWSVLSDVWMSVVGKIRHQCAHLYVLENWIASSLAGYMQRSVRSKFTFKRFSNKIRLP